MFSLYSAIYGVGFRDAIRQLAAKTGATPRGREEYEAAVRRRERIAKAATDLAERERVWRMEYRDTIHSMQRITRDMRARLQSCTSADSKECATYGHVLSMALDELREATAAYALLSFGMIAARADFVQHPGSRDRAIAAVMTSGIVRDDQGHLTEVSP